MPRLFSGITMQYQHIERLFVWPADLCIIHLLQRAQQKAGSVEVKCTVAKTYEINHFYWHCGERNSFYSIVHRLFVASMSRYHHVALFSNSIVRINLWLITRIGVFVANPYALTYDWCMLLDTYYMCNYHKFIEQPSYQTNPKCFVITSCIWTSSLP